MCACVAVYVGVGVPMSGKDHLAFAAGLDLGKSKYTVYVMEPFSTIWSLDQ